MTVLFPHNLVSSHQPYSSMFVVRVWAWCRARRRHVRSAPASRSQAACVRADMVAMKLKERLALAASAAAVLFTLLLVADLQMEYGFTGRHPPLHARLNLADTTDPAGAAYLEFRKRFLQKT